jgi:hypothetical protein
MFDRASAYFELGTDELALVISMAAFVLPLAIQLFKWLRRRLGMEPARTVEFYFGQLNSNVVGLTFTLLATHGRFFIRRISARVLNVSTGRYKDFEWTLIRRRTLAETLGTGDLRAELAAEAAAPFVIMDGECRTLDLMLIDWATQPEFLTIANSAAEAAGEAFARRFAGSAGREQPDLLDEIGPYVHNTPALNEAYRKMGALMFWNEAPHAIELEVLTQYGPQRYYLGTAVTAETMAYLCGNLLMSTIAAVKLKLGLNWNMPEARLVRIGGVRGAILFWLTRHAPTLLRRKGLNAQPSPIIKPAPQPR